MVVVCNEVVFFRVESMIIQVLDHVILLNGNLLGCLSLQSRLRLCFRGGGQVARQSLWYHDGAREVGKTADVVACKRVVFIGPAFLSSVVVGLAGGVGHYSRSIVAGVR